MKHIIHIIILCMAIALASPCAAKSQDTPTSTEAAASKKADSISITKMTVELDSIGKRINKHSELIASKQDRLPSWMIFLFFTTVALSVASISLCFYLFYKQSEIEHLKSILQELKAKYDAHTAKYNGDTLQINNTFKKVKQELDEIKRNIRSKKPQSPPAYPTNSLNGGPFQVDAAPRKETIYFGDVIGNVGSCYFNNARTTSSGAIFKATKSDNIADFEPIGLDVLIGNDNARKVIDFSGVITQKATRMRVVRPGRAIFADGDWNVMQNVQVELM